MIYDKIENVGRYKNISRNLKMAIEYIEKMDMDNPANNALIIGNDEIRFSRNKYSLKDAGTAYFENHTKYTDIQICLDKGEIIHHADKSQITNTVPYDEKNDAEFGTGESYNKLVLSKGSFVIFFPNDAHKSCIKYKDYVESEKLIVKVKHS